LTETNLFLHFIYSPTELWIIGTHSSGDWKVKNKRWSNKLYEKWKIWV